MTITLPLPPSINRTYKTGNGHFYKSREAHDWETEALWEIKRQVRYPYPMLGRLSVHLTFYFERDSDIDSRIKAVLDVLQKGQAISNDRDITHLEVLKIIDKVKPRADIRIEKI